MRSSNASSKLYVGDSGDNRKADLTRVFSKYGEVSTIYVDENKHFAFVEFTSPIDAQRALERTNHKTVNGSKLRVEYAKSEKPSRRALSRERSPTSLLYNHLQVTANRLPSMPVFRHGYHQHPSSTSMPTSVSLSNSSSRGRSLTPPSLKHNPRLPPMHQLRAQDFYYPPILPPPHHHHPAMYSDPTYYRNYVDPYLAQRLPPSAFVSAGSSRAFRHMYSPPGNDRYLSGPSSPQRHRRSRTRPSREHKRKRRASSSSTQPQERGPRTPPPSKTSTHSSGKRSRSGSDAVASRSEQKSSSSSSSDDEDKRSQETDSNRKHSKRKVRE